jgi:hypothetical protein
MNLILGHNQFLGISHTSESKSWKKDIKFSDVKHIYEVVETAAEVGFTGMIIETHPRMIKFLEYYGNNKTFDFDFYLQVPYVQNYVQQMNEKGMRGVIDEVINKTGFLGASGLALKSGLSYLKKDYMSLGMSMLKLEIAPFDKISLKGLLLHNVVTDLLLSLQLREGFETYVNFVRSKLDIKPGLITLNLPMLVKGLDVWNLKSDYIMTPINPNGYDMNPSKEQVETTLQTYKGEIIAMNVLGGGAFSVKDSYEYLKSIHINNVVVGASSRENLKQISDFFCGEEI